MYLHLIHGALHFQLKAVEECIDGKALVGGEKNASGEKVYASGSFPSIRIKLPDKLTGPLRADPPSPTDQDEVKQQMLSLIEKMRELEPRLSSVPMDQKVEHPAFGHLNAYEWFQLVEMHFRHHLHQKERLDPFLCEQ